MSTISFLNISMHGRVNPTLPLVAELVRRGHTVSYHTAPAFADEIHAAGAAVYHYDGPDQPLPDPPTPLGLVAGLATMTVDFLPRVLRDLRNLRPDLVVHDSACLWGALAARGATCPRPRPSRRHRKRGPDQHGQVVGEAAAGIVAEPQLGGVPEGEQQRQHQHGAHAARGFRHPATFGGQGVGGAADAQARPADLDDVAGGEIGPLPCRHPAFPEPRAVDRVADRELQPALTLAERGVLRRDVGIVEDDVAGDGASDGDGPAAHRQRDARPPVAVEDVDDAEDRVRRHGAVEVLVHRNPSR